MIHIHETKTSTNTGRLASLVLPNSDVRIRGGLDQPMSTEGLVRDDYQSLVLFPSDDAIELTPEWLRSLGRPVQLIVPDGTWRQASRLARRAEGLESIPRVKLPAGPPSQFKLRVTPREDGVSTFEAIARAMGILEGSEIQKAMESFFEVMVERTLWSRGKLRNEDCKHPIPPEALEANYRAGCEGGGRKREPSSV